MYLPRNAIASCTSLFFYFPESKLKFIRQDKVSVFFSKFLICLNLYKSTELDDRTYVQRENSGLNKFISFFCKKITMHCNAMVPFDSTCVCVEKKKLYFYSSQYPVAYYFINYILFQFFISYQIIFKKISHK